MYLANIQGIRKLLREKPKLGRIAARNLGYRAFYKLQSSRSKGRSHPPEMITVFVTDRCNMRCRECHYAYTDTPGYQLNQVGEMDQRLFHKLMDEVPGHPIVSFTGGEPLLHLDIADFIAYAKEKGRLCSLVTNGWMLVKRAQSLCEAGLDILSVSLNGPEDIHNALRGDKSFERLVDGLQIILQQPERPLVFVNMTISDLNYDKLVQTYEMVKSFRVDGMNFNHLWMHTDGMVKAFQARYSLFPVDDVVWEVQPEAVDVAVLADGLESIRRLNVGSSFVLSEAPYLSRAEIAAWYQNPEQPVKYQTVRGGWIRLKVWSDGKVKPCRDWEIGDISQGHVMEIWNSHEYQEFRRSLATHGMFPICTRCCLIAHR